MENAKHIGGIAALAVALGMGMAVANTPAVASAEPADNGKGSSSGGPSPSSSSKHSGSTSRYAFGEDSDERPRQFPGPSVDLDLVSRGRDRARDSECTPHRCAAKRSGHLPPGIGKHVIQAQPETTRGRGGHYRRHDTPSRSMRGVVPAAAAVGRAASAIGRADTRRRFTAAPAPSSAAPAVIAPRRFHGHHIDPRRSLVAPCVDGDHRGPISVRQQRAHRAGADASSFDTVGLRAPRIRAVDDRS